MKDTDHTTDDQPATSTLEQRITALERENKSFRRTLEQQNNRRPNVTRRGALGILGGSAILGLAGTAGAQGGNGNGPPFADKDHDHSGDYLGEGEPVDRIDSNSIYTDEVSTTKYADSIAEVNNYIENAPSESDGANPSGVKIVLRQGELTPSSEDLPIELTYGVVIEGQGEKATQITVDGIGKPVFKWDQSGEKLGKHVALRNLSVIGDGLGSEDAAPGSKAAFFKNVAYILIENCRFQRLQDGVVAPNCFAMTLLDTRIDQCDRDGFRATGKFDNTIAITQCEIKRCSRHNIYINASNGAKGIFINGTDISGSSKYGILVKGASGLTIHGCYTENNGGDSQRGPGLDRDGDGTVEPVQIALSPDSSDPPTRGVSIKGTTLGQSNGNSSGPAFSAGIKLNNVEDADIAGNYLTRRRNKSLVELGPGIKNVSIRDNYAREDASTSTVTGPLDGSNIPAKELNDGVWRTSDLGGYENIETLARDYVAKERTNGIEVVLTDDLTGENRVVDGSAFPPGTLFRGVGATGTTIESTGSTSDSYAVVLSRPEQSVMNLSTRSSDQGYGVGIESAAQRCGVWAVVCRGDGDSDIDVTGEGARIVGCDADVDSSNVNTIAEAANLDTL